MSSIVQQFTEALREFMKGGYHEIYKYIFGSPQWPFWFVVQCVWSCYVVRRSCSRQSRTVMNCVKQIFVACLMTFGSRELFGFLWKRPSPIRTHPEALGIFSVVFFVMTFSPFNVVFKVITFATLPLGLAQSFNVMRYYTLMHRAAKTLDRLNRLPVSVGFAVLDQVLEILLRGFLSGVETRLSNGQSVIITSFATVGWWLSTRRTKFTKWVGLHDANLSALVAGFILGVANSASAASVIADPPVHPGATPTMTTTTTTTTTITTEENEEPTDLAQNIVNFKGPYAELMNEIGSEQGVVVIELWAEWNAESKRMQERLPQIAVEHPDMKFVMIECGQNAEIAFSLEVDKVPDVRFYDSGICCGNLVGYDVEQLEEKLQEIVKT
jgi:hypothetical protein